MKRVLPDFIFKFAVEATSTGVIVTNNTLDDNPVIYANPFFQQLTGYREDEVIGKNCRFLQGADSDSTVIRQIRDALHANGVFQGEILNYRKDGSPFWNYLTINPVKDSEGNVPYFIGIQQDITVQKHVHRHPPMS